MPDRPRGTVSFLFTDIEGSTRLWREHPEAMQTASDRHDALLHDVVSAHHGAVYKTVGDAAQIAFDSAPAAVDATVQLQQKLAEEAWGALGLPEPLRVRSALHAGAVDPDPDGDYRSPVLNRLGRLLTAGHGGQILLTDAAFALARGHLADGVTPRDLGLHRFKDLLEPERITQLLVPGVAHEFPPLRSLDAHPHHLPLQPNPFLGREQDIVRVVEQLRRPNVRLVTLTGPGGTGKTRLGLQAAAELVDDFADGVFFVPLAPLVDPTLVPAAIASVLGVREAGGRAIGDLLHDELGPKTLLLVLDNVEQVVAAAPAIGELLAAAPALKILATSRIPLRLRAEQELPVPPLSLPKRKPPPSLEHVTQYEAVRLFVARARAVKPDFAIDNDSAPAVAEICHRLDGLPLAIELAAARVRLLPPHAILARLGKRLSLLTGGSRDLPERQRTLQAAIAWSDDLLAPHERALFRRLAVFAGGWTLEAAEAVAGSPESGETELNVFDGLDRLLEHSLVRQEDGLSGEPRFSMLETIREYALGQLDASGEAGEARGRHADHFLTLAEQGDQQMRGKDTVAALARTDAEHDNMRAALGWACDQAAAEPALRLTAALARFWNMRGYLTEGRSWIERALAIHGKPSATIRANALASAAFLADWQSDLTAAAARYAAALAIAQEIGQVALMAEALNGLGNIALRQDDLVQAEKHYGESLALSRQSGDRRWIAIVVNNLGLLVARRGDINRAITLLEESLALDREQKNPFGIASSLVNLSELSLIHGDRTRARQLLREVLAAAVALGLKDTLVAQALAIAASLAASGGRLERAARLFGAGEALLTVLGGVGDMVLDEEHERALAAVRASLGEASFTKAWAFGQVLPLEAAIAEARAEVGAEEAGRVAG